MYYGNIMNCDVANGEGVRITLFVSGCRRHCKGCFNQNTWDFKYGKPFDQTTKQELLDLLNQPFIQGLTILGGEPMEPENQPTIKDLIKTIKSTMPDKDIWLYSGFTLEELRNENNPVHTKNTNDILNNIDVLVDGPFEKTLKNPSLKFRGSENQRIIHLSHPEDQK